MKRVIMKKTPESVLATRMSNYMLLNYNKIPFRFDIGADVPLPIGIAKRAKLLHSKWSRGYPDMFIATCRGKYGGLYLELKATKTVLDNEHTRTQAQFHEVLRFNGYKVSFCCGYDECVTMVKKYMGKKSKKKSKKKG